MSDTIHESPQQESFRLRMELLKMALGIENGDARVMDAMKCHVCGAQSTIEHAPHCSFRGLPEHRRIAKLERDQADWRKGVAFIASCAGDTNPNLCAVRIGEIVLRMRAELEALKGRVHGATT